MMRQVSRVCCRCTSCAITSWLGLGACALAPAPQMLPPSRPHQPQLSGSVATSTHTSLPVASCSTMARMSKQSDRGHLLCSWWPNSSCASAVDEQLTGQAVSKGGAQAQPNVVQMVGATQHWLPHCSPALHDLVVVGVVAPRVPLMHAPVMLSQYSPAAGEWLFEAWENMEGSERGGREP